jgi:putative ABC transport system permease protein
MHALWQDIRYGLRMLGKNPGFTAIAVLTLALGIGANTAMFSLLNQIMLRRLPVRNPQELVILHDPGPKTGSVHSDGDETESFSFPMYKGLRDSKSDFSGILGRFGFSASISSRGQTERGSGELVTGNYFDVLGVRPELGRVFSLDDDRAPGGHPVVVLSHAFWTRRFGGDPGVLNQILLVNNSEMTIVGVARAGFSGIQLGQSVDVFVPMMMTAKMAPHWGDLNEWNNYWLTAIARRKSDVSAQQALASLNAAYHPLLEEQLPKITGWDEKKRQLFLNGKLVGSPGGSGRWQLQRDAGAPLEVLFGMVALVLLIACSNVANLLLAQGAARQKEFMIRTALGASRSRMVRQLMAESLLCALGGGALGLLLGTWLMNLLTPIVASNVNVQGLSASLDSSVLLFAIGATLASGILFGLIPAWRVTRSVVSQTQSLKDTGSTSSMGVSHVRTRKLLVAGQVAFTMLLLAGAFLFTRTLWNLRKQNIGMKTESVIAFSISPSLNGYDVPRTVALVDQLRMRLATVPGVRAIGSSEIPTLTGSANASNITVEGYTPPPGDEDYDVCYDAISPGYFSALSAPLLSGREFTDADAADKPKVAVISQAMAKHFFAGRDPIGAHFAFGGGTKVKPNIEVVGVVTDAQQRHVRSETVPYIYIPYAQIKTLSDMTFYVRTQQDPLLLAASLRKEVQLLDANLPVYDLKTFDRIVDEDLFAERLVAALSAGFGSLAALLAALGIYGVLTYLVLQRTREIGIRMALGAEAGHVRALIVKEVASMVLAGVAVGLPLAYGLARLSESLLFGVHSSDPGVYALGLLLIAAVALAACYIPSRRATRVDPLVALRYE